MSFIDASIACVKGSDYTIYFWYMGKDDAINIKNNSYFNEKVGCYNFFCYIWNRNKEKIRNREIREIEKKNTK